MMRRAVRYFVMSVSSNSGLRYNQKVIAPGAQTERRGDAGPGRGLLSRRVSPRLFLFARVQASGFRVQRRIRFWVIGFWRLVACSRFLGGWFRFSDPEQFGGFVTIVAHFHAMGLILFHLCDGFVVPLAGRILVPVRTFGNCENKPVAAFTTATELDRLLSRG